VGWKVVERELFVVRPLLTFFVPPTLDFLTPLGDAGFLIAAEGKRGPHVVSEGSSLTLNFDFLGNPRDLTMVGGMAHFAPPIRLGIFPVPESLRRTESFFPVEREVPTVDLEEWPTVDLGERPTEYLAGRPRGFLPRPILTVSSDEVVYSAMSSKKSGVPVFSRFWSWSLGEFLGSIVGHFRILLINNEWTENTFS
jgi:hypothetical protein